jgi:hypothetical protein
VIDGDLQHERLLPDARLLRAGEHEIVVGSRYVRAAASGGRAAGVMSRLSTLPPRSRWAWC